MAQSTEPTQLISSSNAQTVTRAEVLADLTIYRESGLLDLERGNRTEGGTSAYTEAEKRYQELRDSSAYVRLVHSFASKTGEKMTLAKPPAGAAVQQ